jgi:four helix bundle protein
MEERLSLEIGQGRDYIRLPSPSHLNFTAMNPLIGRTRQFAVDVLRLCSRPPRSREFAVIENQLAKAGSSVGANYRATCRARSRREFIAKLSIVEEEADEAQFWLELLMELLTAEADELRRLHKEADEFVAILVAAKRTARRNRN